MSPSISLLPSKGAGNIVGDRGPFQIFVVTKSLRLKDEHCDLTPPSYVYSNKKQLGTDNISLRT